MGTVIKPDTEGDAPAALTKTGKGRFLSKGYLRDEPAAEYLGAAETPVYVITNGEEGVTKERDGEETAITPGNGYRTIAVVTDQRLIVLVGDAGEGDERIVLPLVEIGEARAAEGTLVVAMRSGERWRIHAGDGEVDAVADAIERVLSVREGVDEALGEVKRTLASATAERDRGEYEGGIDDAGAAYDRLGEAEELLEELPADWPSEAVEARIEDVHDRCVRTLADLHIGHGRSLLERASGEWDAEEYERAHDTYDRARAEFEAVVALNADRHDRAEAVADGLERIEEATEELAAEPLERAIEADRRAGDAEEPVEAVEHWRCARERYEATLSLDDDAPERRFAGEPEKIRDRIEAVTERVLRTARDDGAEALGAGKWFLEADRPTVAREEARVARDIFEEALAVAAAGCPEDVPEFEEWLGDAEETLTAAAAEDDGPEESDPDRAEAEAQDDGADGDLAEQADEADDGADGDLVEPPEETDDGAKEAEEEDHLAEPDGEVDDGADGDAGRVERIPSATGGGVAGAPTNGDGDADAPDDGGLSGPSLDDADLPDLGGVEGPDGTDEPENESPGSELEQVVSDGAGAAAREAMEGSLEMRLRSLDPDGFDALARILLETDGFDASSAPEEAPHALRATPTAGDGDPLAVWTFHRPIAGPVDVGRIERVAELARDLTPEPAIVTSRESTAAANEVAAEASIRLLDRSDIAAAIDDVGELIERSRSASQ